MTAWMLLRPALETMRKREQHVVDPADIPNMDKVGEPESRCFSMVKSFLERLSRLARPRRPASIAQGHHQFNEKNRAAGCSISARILLESRGQRAADQQGLPRRPGQMRQALQKHRRRHGQTKLDAWWRVRPGG